MYKHEKCEDTISMLPWMH